MRTGTDSDEEPFPLDATGFLDGSVTVTTTAEELVPGMLVHPSVAAGVGALVLLGEPGVGKTTVFTELTDGLVPLSGADDGDGRLLHLDAVRLTDANFDALLGRHLRQLPTRSGSTGRPSGAASVASPPALTIVIDQLDESPMLRRFAPELAAALADRDATGLRILVACRTADYPTAITEVLSSALGDCVLADLAPLTRPEAVKLADSAGVSGEALVTAAAAVAAGTLASVPLTLELLVRIYVTEARLPPTAAEVFAQGVRRLADEHDPDRRARESAIGIDEKVAIAGRLAARLLLAGRRTIWTGPDLDAGMLDVRSGSLTGGFERVASGQFNVTPAAVTETIGTALFTGRGADRLAFRHSSVAAYLAARYLIDHDVPEPQLRSLFLVAADDATTSIPAPLREAAAWLVALDPDRSKWLAEADPESLASHSLVVDSFAIRALVVESLLARAPEIELGEHRWLRARWRLEHPGLGEQLSPVFRDIHDGEPQDWATNAQVRLAARLAQEARARELVDPLLNLAEHEGWSAHMRRLAAAAAFEAAPEEASARLKGVLNTLANASHASEVDPDDELRGAILDMLWPDHLRAEEIIVHLRPRRRRSLFGSYALFLGTMADRLSEDDVAIVLAWAERASREGLVPEQDDAIEEASLETQGDDDEVLDPSELPVGRVDTNLSDALVSRALASARAEEHLEAVSALFRRRLQRHDDLSLPEPLNLVDKNGKELDRSRDLRRALALALLGQMANEGEVDRVDCWQLISGWRATGLWRNRQALDETGPRPGDRHALIDSTDLRWALDAADDYLGRGEIAVARGLGLLASMIFDWRDVEAVDLVAGRQDNPAWEFLRWWFQPVRLDSPEADTMRQHMAWSRPRESQPWPEAEAFQARVRDQFAEARSGDPSAFWQLAWKLQLDPATGRGIRQLGDRLLAFPGVSLLDDDASQGLVEAAQRYVRSEEDHAEEWLGTDRYDKRAWAGYLALALLHEHGVLDQLDEEVWTRWCGALVWFHAVPVNAGDRDRKVDLLSRAARSAPQALSSAVVTYVRGELARGGRPSEVELLDLRWSDELRGVLVDLVAEISDALRFHHAAAETAEVGSDGGKGPHGG